LRHAACRHCVILHGSDDDVVFFPFLFAAMKATDDDHLTNESSDDHDAE
jgi:hypothetical protein